ncbi:MAG: hypothetical protein QOI40_222 [Alphaproteobacteria bacterium]|nr:hypothetical protein [Alphaproteobacteria bacterium]
MPDDSRFPEPRADDGLGLPSRMIVFALAALGVLLLALAATSSERVASPHKGVIAKTMDTLSSPSRQFDPDSDLR